jgi:hypothetical protein
LSLRRCGRVWGSAPRTPGGRSSLTDDIIAHGPVIRPHGQEIRRVARRLAKAPLRSPDKKVSLLAVLAWPVYDRAEQKNWSVTL